VFCLLPPPPPWNVLRLLLLLLLLLPLLRPRLVLVCCGRIQHLRQHRYSA
jgi:hypothetical protein